MLNKCNKKCLQIIYHILFIQVILLHTIKITVLNTYAFIHLFKKMFHQKKWYDFVPERAPHENETEDLESCIEKNLAEQESRKSMNTINIPDQTILILYIFIQQ